MNPLVLIDGYKTYIAGAGLVGLAIYQASQGDYKTALETFSAGLAAIGLRHSIQKAAG